jgi:hypothetical protein
MPGLALPRPATTRPDSPCQAKGRTWSRPVRPSRAVPGYALPSQAMEATVTLTIRLPDDVYDKLRKAAFDQHTSMNALIIAALRAQQDT